jgi:protein-S-isoprenylcysteine O-methyltransferase Ste14
MTAPLDPLPPLGRRAWAWTGGLVFVAALAVYAWFFAVRLDRPTAPGVPLAVAAPWNVLIFGAFAAHHSLLARTRAKAWITRHVPVALERSLYVWTASLLLVAVCLLWAHVPGVVYAVPWPWAPLGYAAQIAGVWLTLRGAAVIAPLELAGIRQVYGDLRPAAFRVVGPFRWVRHPIYCGWVLIVFGAPHMTVDRLSWAVISSAYLVIAIPFEERSLVDAFGEDYRAYQARVRWRLVPGLW